MKITQTESQELMTSPYQVDVGNIKDALCVCHDD